MGERPSSPTCNAADASDEYMGFAGRDELITALNELLEAERAGARVAVESRKEADPSCATLLKAVGADEARWCTMLTSQLERLGADISDRTGAFHTKAMAIELLADRLAFLNRGQAWVVRKLEALLPRVRDDNLHADLKAMLERHRANIETTERYLASPVRE